ncbi:MAG: Gldg family protein [Rhodospirillales bacterium]|nr:Gldg family protein [Rhodospirillales bacterium]
MALSLRILGSTSPSSTALAAIAIVLAIVFFFAVNILAGSTLKTARLDLTEDGIYTLTDATRAVLAAIDEPIRLRYYRSSQLETFGPYYANHAARVDALLEQYARIADGRLEIERFDPEPYAPEEDLAVADGISPLTVGNGGSLAYFGIAGTNATDDDEAIPYLAPERAEFLEYDLTRLIHDLANPDKQVVGVIGDLPLFGDQFSRGQPWMVAESLQAFFTVRMLKGGSLEVDDDVDILLLAQPTTIDDKTLYAIDQFVLRGGKVLAFVDPFAETLAVPGRPPGAASAVQTLEPLLTAWGVEVTPGQVVGDRNTALRVRARHQGRPVITDYVVWLALGKAQMAADDAVSGDLQVVVMKSAGAIRGRDGATTTVEPLITTSPEAMLIDVQSIQFLPEPIKLLQAFVPAGQPFTVAARVTGPVSTAFPDGPPKDGDTEDDAQTGGAAGDPQQDEGAADALSISPDQGAAAAHPGERRRHVGRRELGAQPVPARSGVLGADGQQRRSRPCGAGEPCRRTRHGGVARPWHHGSPLRGRGSDEAQRR